MAAHIFFRRKDHNTIQTCLFIFILVCCACSDSNKQAQKQSQSETKQSAKSVIEITSEEQFKKIIENSPDKLLIFDLYADWCMPCKIIAPTLEELAKENSGKATFYKINIDKLQNIAVMFGVSGIPFVVFVINKNGVHALTGVQPKAEYQRAITRFAPAQKSENQNQDNPDGELIDGIRVIKRTTATKVGNIYVYRGETVKLIINNVEDPYEISIPQYNAKSQAAKGQNIEVTFKAVDIGVFPIFCNGKCPVDDGSNLGQIIVMQYKSTQNQQYSEINSDEAAKLIESTKPIILDVRSPNEYYAKHLKNAILIPVQQLETRVAELDSFKTAPILIYCHSGNRSTVAAQILNKHGFNKIYNLRKGIVEWESSGFPMIK